ncbi:MAG TPA: DUF4430 domain-containing protein [Anaerovoracaceae bacterium]|nr:DUF4430 domain-containing protein [Anaerovoracaceae bacterium]
MKKRYLLLTLIITLMAAMVVLSGCETSDDMETPIDADTISVTMSIDYPVKSDIPDVEDVVLTVEEDATVLDMLQVYCASNDTPVTVELMSSEVQGINNVLNGEYGNDRKWFYSLNDKSISTMPGEKEIKDGDSVMWYYRAAPQK